MFQPSQTSGQTEGYIPVKQLRKRTYTTSSNQQQQKKQKQHKVTSRTICIINDRRLLYSNYVRRWRFFFTLSLSLPTPSWSTTCAWPGQMVGWTDGWTFRWMCVKFFVMFATSANFKCHPELGQDPWKNYVLNLLCAP